jgi:rSAM/selenodomain-associated transferase 1
VTPPRGSLIVFAKEPLPGRVKTRMTPPLSPELAAHLYRELLQDVLAATGRAARTLGLAPVLAVHPPEACERMAGLASPAFRIVPQIGASLGARMEHVLLREFAGGQAPLLLRGSDSPTLDTRCFEAALAGLAAHDLVISPDPDGGYSLVGVNRPAPGLFDHPMSTPSALADTLARARGLGLDAVLLEPAFDLDTVADLRLLAAARSARAELPCPRTLAFLDRHGIWPLVEI